MTDIPSPGAGLSDYKFATDLRNEIIKISTSVFEEYGGVERQAVVQTIDRGSGTCTVMYPEDDVAVNIVMYGIQPDEVGQTVFISGRAGRRYITRVVGNVYVEGIGGGGGGGDHDDLTNVTADQHHAEDHASRHETGGADAIDLSDQFAAVGDLSNYLLLTGGAMTGPLFLPDGSQSDPALAFSSDTDTGIRYLDYLGGQYLNFVVGGVDRFRVQNNFTRSFQELGIVYGDASLPGLFFGDDQDTGLFGADGQLSASVAGTEKMLLDTDALTLTDADVTVGDGESPPIGVFGGDFFDTGSLFAHRREPPYDVLDERSVVLFSYLVLDPTADHDESEAAIIGSVATSSGDSWDHGYLYGGRFGSVHFGGGNVGSINGVYAHAETYWDGSGTADEMRAFRGSVHHDAATAVTSVYGLWLEDIQNAGTITNSYGIYIGLVDVGTVTNAYGIYQEDANASNFFAGDLAMGTGAIIDFTDELGDKIHWWSNTYGTGIEFGTLTNWSNSTHKWGIGGTSAATTTEKMSLTATALTLASGVQLIGPTDPTAGTHVGDRDYNDARYPLIGDPPAAHTHTEADITDLGAYITDITGEPLSDLSDVTVTGPATSDLIQWSGSAWVDRTLAEAGVAAASHNHATADVTSGTFADARIAESNITQHEAALDHDALSGFVAAEHLDWSVTGAEDIHVDRIAEGAVTQHEAALTLPSTQVSDWAEAVQDTAGDMFTGNTETGITATYQDGDGTVDLEVALDLNDLGDVDASSPSAADTLAYNDGTGNWEPTAAGAPGAHDLDGASHTASGLTARDVLTADTATTFSWKPLVEADISDLTHAPDSWADLSSTDTSQNINVFAWTLLNWNVNNTVDSDWSHSTSTNKPRLTANFDGKARFTAIGTIETAVTDASMWCAILRNGTVKLQTSTSVVTNDAGNAVGLFHVTWVDLDVSDGDYYEIGFLREAGGGTVNIGSGLNQFVGERLA